MQRRGAAEYIPPEYTEIPDLLNEPVQRKHSKALRLKHEGVTEGGEGNVLAGEQYKVKKNHKAEPSRPREAKLAAQMDGEGRQMMRTLARNMTFLMKSIALGKEAFELPEMEERVATHFIR